MASPKSEVIGRCCLIACERDPILTTDGRTDVRAYSVQESEKKGGSYIYKYIMIIPLTVHYCSTYNKGFFDNAIFNFQLNSIENLLKCLTRQRSIFFFFCSYYKGICKFFKCQQFILAPFQNKPFDHSWFLNSILDHNFSPLGPILLRHLMCGNLEASFYAMSRLQRIFMKIRVLTVFSLCLAQSCLEFSKRIVALNQVPMSYVKVIADPSVKSFSQSYFFFHWAYMHYFTHICWIRDVK